jgi:hypothetical protein
MLATWRKCKNSEMMKPAIVINKNAEIFGKRGFSIFDGDIAAIVREP